MYLKIWWLVQILPPLTPHYSVGISVIKYTGFSHDLQLYPMR